MVQEIILYLLANWFYLPNPVVWGTAQTVSLVHRKSRFSKVVLLYESYKGKEMREKEF